ncbi:hypothetical protein D3C87_78440 [compost metagenome]
MNLTTEDTIEFSSDGKKLKGNILKIDKENITINLFAAQTTDKWYYFGVYNESTFQVSDLKDIVIIAQET